MKYDIDVCFETNQPRTFFNCSTHAKHGLIISSHAVGFCLSVTKNDTIIANMFHTDCGAKNLCHKLFPSCFKGIFWHLQLCQHCHSLTFEPWEWFIFVLLVFSWEVIIWDDVDVILLAVFLINHGWVMFSCWHSCFLGNFFVSVPDAACHISVHSVDVTVLMAYVKLLLSAFDFHQHLTTRSSELSDAPSAGSKLVGRRPWV